MKKLILLFALLGCESHSLLETVRFEITNQNDERLRNVEFVAVLYRSGVPIDTESAYIQAIGSGVTFRHYWDSRRLDRLDSLEFCPLYSEADGVLKPINDVGGK